MSFTATHSLQGTPIIKDTETGKWWISHVEDSAFRNAIIGLYDYVGETNADIDTAYDWVCEMSDIFTFVADTYAWNMFYDVYQQCKLQD